METINPADRLKIVLDLIHKLPEFNGSSNLLNDFLDRVDSLAHVVSTFDNNTQSILLGYIKDRIIGKARIELQKHGRLGDWNQIREILKTNFSEKLSANKLLDQIRTARVEKNIEDFYSKINYLLSRLNNSYVFTENENNEAIITSNKRIALEAFKDNLPEPTKSIILSRNPQSLFEAYKIISEINHLTLGPNSSGSTQYFRQPNRTNNFNASNNYRSNNNPPQAHSSRNYEGTQSRQNNNSSNSLPRNNFRQNNNNGQNNNSQNQLWLQNSNNNSQSNQTRRSNRSVQPNNQNGHEPMDVSMNEVDETHNQPLNPSQNFRPTHERNYLI
ncbi:homeobox protein 4-like [Episyrphus balteatus]|uniref:homeobox protein 4-like n=1 Tax=Episyrphus balteatus TaxID=286459 RepID=UPI0024866DFC|nr:homeobox protein 4-like [Episyrphus balteatus]